MYVEILEYITLRSILSQVLYLAAPEVSSPTEQVNHLPPQGHPTPTLLNLPFLTNSVSQIPWQQDDISVSASTGFPTRKHMNILFNTFISYVFGSQISVFQSRFDLSTLRKSISCPDRVGPGPQGPCQVTSLLGSPESQPLLSASLLLPFSFT